VSFSCTKTGAILSLPLPARRQDTLARGDFGKWMVKHIDLWFAFTRRLGLGITRMEEIVLVTGCHLARSWANIAFLESRGEEQVSFGVRVSVEWRFPPEEVQGVASNLGPSGKVCFYAFFLIHKYQDCSWTNTTGSESTRGPMYIYQGLSCQPIVGDPAETSRSSRFDAESR
jgi:hypothetical protein